MKINSYRLESIGFLMIAAVLFAMVILTRPLIPIDETRYVSVAWEMWLRHDWFAPLTMNFEPYSHKPPMLFWMIDLCWALFGVNRWAATIPVVLMAFANIFLIARIHEKLFPAEEGRRASWVMLGSVPFLIYATLILFDLSVCVFVQMAILCLLNFAKDGRWRWMVGMGFVLGLGMLTKGPVAYLYVIFPVLLGPLWFENSMPKARWYSGFLLALLVSIPPVLVWLIPVLKASDNQFAFWLVWNQTAGRVTGNFSDAHNRPFYFYFMVLPILILPWGLFPAFWRSLKNSGAAWKAEPSVRFLVIWAVPAFLAFCGISGKQPHYLVPLIPAVMIYMTHVLAAVSKKNIMKITGGVLIAFVAVHIVATSTALYRYDMTPLAEKLHQYKDRDIAFVRNYHGEVGFLAGLDHHVDDVGREDIRAWFKAHPHGIAVIRFEKGEETKGMKEIMTQPYRGKFMGLFEAGKEP